MIEACPGHPLKPITVDDVVEDQWGVQQVFDFVLV
jgi:hypothetical protein